VRLIATTRFKGSKVQRFKVQCLCLTAFKGLKAFGVQGFKSSIVQRFKVQCLKAYGVQGFKSSRVQMPSAFKGPKFRV
jgi:hypothetical protein